MNKLLSFVIVFFTIHLSGFGQGATCGAADPFCTGNTYTFPNNTGVGSAGGGNNYDCLSTTPNPAWYYMEVATSGNINIGISQTTNTGAPIDVDFILYGPYDDLTQALSYCGNHGNASTAADPNQVVDCSYDPSPTETAVIPNAQAGDVYIMLLTNYANQAGTIQFSQTGGTGATDCSIVNPCSISALTATPGACVPASNTYTVSGSITFNDAPTTGTLTVTDCHGNSQVFNAPFTSPRAYSISGITSNGIACNVTAVFSADPGCTRTTNYTSPSSCVPVCNLSALTAVPGACVPATNTYTLTGNITFANAPSSGTLTVTSSCGGSQTFNAPFTSPQAYSLAGLTSNGSACSVTAVFSADAICTRTTNYTAPASCTPSCSISSLTAVPGACVPATDTYTLTGVITFSNAPASGTLTVTDCHGGTQVFNAPFTSPQAYSIAGIASDGAACNVVAVFSANAACTRTTNYTSPSSCVVPCTFTGIVD
ncbi:MAG: hypothetical protein KDD24_01845, partial [Flavobacteriales bacterium]|nr:hypothetical protein [Flavobacteriales bacterium]